MNNSIVQEVSCMLINDNKGLRTITATIDPCSSFGIGRNISDENIAVRLAVPQKYICLCDHLPPREPRWLAWRYLLILNTGAYMLASVTFKYFSGHALLPPCRVQYLGNNPEWSSRWYHNFGRSIRLVPYDRKWLVIYIKRHTCCLFICQLNLYSVWKIEEIYFNLLSYDVINENSVLIFWMFDDISAITSRILTEHISLINAKQIFKKNIGNRIVKIKKWELPSQKQNYS